MSLLDLLFPKKCVGCQKTGSYFCPECLLSIKGTSLACPVCEISAPFGQTHLSCQTENCLDGQFSVFVYKGVVKGAIHKLKYRLVVDLAEEFWKLILKQLRADLKKFSGLGRYLREEKPTLVPIPLHWYKENTRGFNQSTIFAKKLAEKFNLPFDDKILKRVKFSSSQSKLKKEERKSNVQGIFSTPHNIGNLPENVLLFDDVWTTGATMKEACRVLKRAGVKKVWGITIAK